MATATEASKKEACGALPRVVVLTGTRADWGLLHPLARALEAEGVAGVTVAATNMHLSPRFGNTLSEITAAGFSPVCLPMEAEPADERERVRAMARCMEETAALLAGQRPKAAIVLGDRFEALAFATACLMMRVPIVHLHGGETTLGAIDDAMRHAITQMSSLHLVSTKPYASRVVAMGADPAHVVVTGAPGAAAFDTLERATPAEIAARAGMEVDADTVLVTYHPATRHHGLADRKVEALGRALDLLPGLKAVITAPNNDEEGAAMHAAWQAYAAGRPDRTVRASLGHRVWLSAMERAGAVVGNSSSGIIEAPSAGVPTLDIGPRQQGRIMGPSVVHTDADLDPQALAEALHRALSLQMRALAARRENPYHLSGTTAVQVQAVARFLNSLK